MKLIKPSFLIKNQEPGLLGIYRQIEYAGRISYKSQNKITEDSAKPFVDRMINSGHGAVLEHGTVYLYCKADENNNPLEDYFHNHYSKAIWMGQGKYANVYITTNMRVLVEHNRLDDLKYLCESTEYHAKRITVKFICDRGILAEFTRHRVFSFMAESSRYCNYSKDRFNRELTFIQPSWLTDKNISHWKTIMNSAKWFLPDNDVASGIYTFMCALERDEDDYLSLINEEGWKAQQARAILPNALKTELVMTGFVDDWWGKYIVIDKSTGLIDKVINGRNYKEVDTIDRDKYRIVEKGFFPLRCSSAAHPSARELAIPLREEFIKRKY